MGFPRLGCLGPWWAGVVGGRRAPPRLARLLGLGQLVVGVCRCPYCVRLCMTRSSVPPGTPKLPADCVLVLGNGLSCVVRHGAGKNFPCSHTPVVPASWHSAAGGAERVETRWWDVLGDRSGHWLRGKGAASRRHP